MEGGSGAGIDMSADGVISRDDGARVATWKD